MQNLLTDLPCDLPDELTDVLVDNPNVRIERIISTGHSSPPGFWYDQDENEWILVLSGAARLLFADAVASQLLTQGDQLIIPAHRKHRVEWTSPNEPTVWLAVFYPG